MKRDSNQLSLFAAEQVLDWEAPPVVVPERKVTAPKRSWTPPVLSDPNDFGAHALLLMRSVGPWTMSPCRVAVAKLGTAVEFDFAGNLGSLRVGTDVRIDRLGEVATAGLLRWALGDETLGVAAIPVDELDQVMSKLAVLVEAERARRVADSTAEPSELTTAERPAAETTADVEPLHGTSVPAIATNQVPPTTATGEFRFVIDADGAKLFTPGRESAPVVKGMHNGWQWSPRLKAWYQQRRSLDSTIAKNVVNTAMRLESDGHAWTVDRGTESASLAAEIQRHWRLWFGDRPVWDRAPVAQPETTSETVPEPAAEGPGAADGFRCDSVEVDFDGGKPGRISLRSGDVSLARSRGAAAMTESGPLYGRMPAADWWAQGRALLRDAAVWELDPEGVEAWATSLNAAAVVTGTDNPVEVGPPADDESRGVGSGSSLWDAAIETGRLSVATIGAETPVPAVAEDVKAAPDESEADGVATEVVPSVEVHVAPGYPSFSIIGMHETNVRAVRDRVRAAVLSSGFEWPNQKVTINIVRGPERYRRQVPCVDVAIAVGILATQGIVPAGRANQRAFAGELGLDGTIRPGSNSPAARLVMIGDAVPIEGGPHVPLDVATLRGLVAALNLPGPDQRVPPLMSVGDSTSTDGVRSAAAVGAAPVPAVSDDVKVAADELATLTGDDASVVEDRLVGHVAAGSDLLTAARAVAAECEVPEAARELKSVASPMGRAQRNILALRELGAASPDRDRLASWSGWGACPQIFDESNDEWAELRAEARGLMSAQEWDAARRTTLNAHYTDPEIVAAMTDLVELVSVSGRPLRVLEPGCGSGNFLSEDRWSRPVEAVGVELDPATAAVAAALHPAATIRAEGFERTNLVEGLFDATVGNVPFGKYAPYDPLYNEGGHSIHNYFVLKSLRLTAPGGMVAVITSRYTLDSLDASARREMWELADLVGVARLPENAHRATAGTHVVTDVLVFRRRGDNEPRQPFVWEETTEAADLLTHSEYETGKPVPHVNDVFGNFRRGDVAVAIGGSFGVRRGQFTEFDFSVFSSDPTADAVAAVSRMATAVRASSNEFVSTAPMLDRIDWCARRVDEREGTIRVAGNGFERVDDGMWVPHHVPKTKAAELRSLLVLRDRLEAVLEAQAASDDDQLLVPLQERALRAYEAYYATHGAVNRYIESRNGNRTVPPMGGFRDDPGFAVVAASELFDEDSNTGRASDIYTMRVLRRPVPIEHVETVAEAVPVVLNELGRVDVARIAELVGVTESDVEGLAGDVLFRDPISRDLVDAADYLSGNVREKLGAARTAAQTDSVFDRNVTALEAVLPVWLTHDEIQVAPGAAWIAAEDYSAFLASIDVNAEVKQKPGSREWVVNERWSSKQVATRQVWGTERMEVGALFECALSGQAPKVMTGPTKERVVDVQASAEASEKVGLLIDRFSEWVWEDSERRERLVERYNVLFNSTAERRWDGSHLTLPGLSAGIIPHPHQKDAVWRILCGGNAVLDHTVGAGKTGEMVIAAMEMRRLGLARQPWIVVPNHMLEQMAREVNEWYPAARVLLADRKRLGTKEGKQRFAAASAMNDWDCVVLTHSAFESIDAADEDWDTYFAAERARLHMDLASADKSDRRSVKQAETALARLEARQDKKRDGRRTAGTVPFDQTGCDFLMVDEAHFFKNVPIMSKRNNLSSEGSGRAVDMAVKIGSLRRRFGERCVVFATGTPVANSMVEAWTMMSFVRPDVLKAAAVDHVDDWLATFTKSVQRLELKPAGSGWRVVDTIARYRNVPELTGLWRQVADVVGSDDLNVPRPSVRPGGAETVVIERSPEVAALIADLSHRAENLSHSRRPEKGADNMLKITHEGRMAALDPRALGLEVEPGTPLKVDAIAERVAAIWQDTRTNRYSDGIGGVSPREGALQMVFCDRSTPKPGEWNFYDELRDQLAGRGVPRDAVRFVHEADTDAKKARLFRDCREGRVAVLVGSTEKMGTGTNVQRRLVALHHADCPWRPADLEQREGRILRQGNENPEVDIVRYVTAETFDVYMWQTVERKAAFIHQMRSKLPPGTRDMEDFGDRALSFAEVKALASGDPRIIRRAELGIKVEELGRARTGHRNAVKRAAATIRSNDSANERDTRRLETVDSLLEGFTSTAGDNFAAVIDGQTLGRTDYGTHILAVSNELAGRERQVGSHATADGGIVGGVPITLRGGGGMKNAEIAGTGLWVNLAQAEDPVGAARRIENKVAELPELRDRLAGDIAARIKDRPVLDGIVAEPFRHETEWSEAVTQLRQIDSDLAETAAEQAAASSVADLEDGVASLGPATVREASGVRQL